MRLAQWQNAFIDALSQGGNDDGLLSLVNPEHSRRVDIYRNNSLQALTATLSIGFPISLQLVGASCFNQLAKDYTQCHPMLETNLNHYGEDFPVFLQQIIDTKASFAAVKYLGQMAQLEWLLQLSYYAADTANCLPIAQMVELPEELHSDVLLTLRPDIFLHHSTYPLFDIWCAHRHEEPAAIDLGDMDNIHHYDYLCVFRDPFKPLVKVLVKADYDLLKAISDGASLGDMAEGGIDMSRLPQWIEAGWVCGFRLRVDE